MSGGVRSGYVYCSTEYSGHEKPFPVSNDLISRPIQILSYFTYGTQLDIQVHSNLVIFYITRVSLSLCISL